MHYSEVTSSRATSFHSFVAGGSATSATIGGLQRSSRYSVEVAAIGAGELGVFSDPVTTDASELMIIMSKYIVHNLIDAILHSYCSLDSSDSFCNIFLCYTQRNCGSCCSHCGARADIDRCSGSGTGHCVAGPQTQESCDVIAERKQVKSIPLTLLYIIMYNNKLQYVMVINISCRCRVVYGVEGKQSK